MCLIMKVRQINMYRLMYKICIIRNNKGYLYIENYKYNDIQRSLIKNNIQNQLKNVLILKYLKYSYQIQNQKPINSILIQKNYQYFILNQIIKDLLQSIFILGILLQQPYCMIKTQPYNCSTCSISYSNDQTYKIHYKSEHHRYNLKRKLINLPAVTLQQYQAQFQQTSSKSSSHSQFRCQICSKSFMSSSTYNQHLNSSKHKTNRKKISDKKNDKSLNKSNSSSQFSVISDDSQTNNSNKQLCIFCKKIATKDHLAEHNFPPFKENCIDLPGLIKYVQSIINQKQCIFCCLNFSTLEATKQHMMDVGHMQLNIDNFEQFQKFYLWTIEQKDNQDQQWQVINSKNMTLQQLQEYNRNLIKIVSYGARIKNRLIGIRAYKKYYRQYYRQIAAVNRKSNILALTDKEGAVNALEQINIKERSKNATNLSIKKNLLNVYRKNKNY